MFMSNRPSLHLTMANKGCWAESTTATPPTKNRGSSTDSETTLVATFRLWRTSMVASRRAARPPSNPVEWYALYYTDRKYSKLLCSIRSSPATRGIGLLVDSAVGFATYIDFSPWQVTHTCIGLYPTAFKILTFVPHVIDTDIEMKCI